MPKFLQNPWCYAAMGVVAMQFVSGVVMDVVLGAALVGIIAFNTKD